MKIKVIDMLVKMGKDKNYKPTFKYKNNIYKYDFKTKYYIPSFMGLYKIYMILNDEVEIIDDEEWKFEIEEPKKIKKLNDKLGLFGDGNTQKIINELNYTRTIINELIEEINNLKDDD